MKSWSICTPSVRVHNDRDGRHDDLVTPGIPATSESRTVHDSLVLAAARSVVFFDGCCPLASKRVNPRCERPCFIARRSRCRHPPIVSPPRCRSLRSTTRPPTRRSLIRGQGTKLLQLLLSALFRPGKTGQAPQLQVIGGKTAVLLVRSTPSLGNRISYPSKSLGVHTWMKNGWEIVEK